MGRSSSSRWAIDDRQLSRHHFRVSPHDGAWIVEDLKSRNGTYLNGHVLTGPAPFERGDLLRAGGCLFLLVDDLGSLAAPGEGARAYGMAGRFHVGEVVHQLRLAARTGQHVLLEGESGTGKELAAKALHQVFVELGRGKSFVAENAACFAGDDDAVVSLFGADSGVFTGVGPRVGALERAGGGTLFLDEFHNLPPRAQRSLLRFVEEGLLRRLGNTQPRPTDVRLIFGTNLDVDEAVDDGRLAHDLIARLRRVQLPPLRERKADIPSLLLGLIEERLPAVEARAVEACLDTPLLERLCLAELSRGNVRELLQMVTDIAARMAEGEPAEEAVTKTFDEMAPTQPWDEEPASGSPYERHRAEIIETYLELKGNLSKTEATLRGRGVQVNRRWLAVFLERWGVRPVRRRS